MKKINTRFLASKINLLLLLFMSTSLVACGGNDSLDSNPIISNDESSETSEVEEIMPTVGEQLKLVPGVTFDNNKAFFDDFSEGVNPNNWIIGNGAWGQGNGGVIPENVFYTEDGVLVIRGNGRHYAKNEVKGVGMLKDGRNTGGVIISNFPTGPGRYETKMIPLRRQGACTALWTFSNQPVEGQENDNHEIDIELPGGTRSGVISFKNVLNTNYVTERLMTSQDIKLTETIGEQLWLNDGNYHTFGFDWYTDPAMIVYYVDGIVTAVSDTFIPDLQSKLWLGCWFPNNAGFVGQSNFETEYMYIDWVKYLPFENQPSREFLATPSVAPALPNQFPKSPISYPEVNLIANGDFEFIKTKENFNDYGWTFSRLNTEDRPVEEVCFPGLTAGHFSAGATITKGGYLTQNIDSTYEGYKYKLSFDAKSDGQDSRVVANFVNEVSNKAIEHFDIKIEGSEWKHYELDIVAPKDSYALRLEAYNAKKLSTMNIDNVKLVRL